MVSALVLIIYFGRPQLGRTIKVNFKTFQTVDQEGSRTIAPEEHCHPILNLTLNLIQALTLTRGQFSSGAIVLIPIKRYAQF